MYDVIIIGAGITGTLTALQLSQYQLKTAVIDKENDIADGATMANSAIVHTGYDPEDGTLKAKFNVRGAAMYPSLCNRLACVYRKVGAYVAACGKEEEEKQEILKQRAENRYIKWEWLTGEQARKEEPNLSDAVTRVLSFPDTAIIYPWQVAIAAMEVAVDNGCDLFLNTEVQSIEETETGYVIHTKEKTFETKAIINASGTGAAKIAAMVKEDPGFEIHPRKGEYYVIDASVDYVQHVIFPVPSAKGKGVLAVPTVYGNTLIGPDSEEIQDLNDVSTTVNGLSYVRKEILHTMKNPPLRQVIRTFAGLRPSGTTKDFIVGEMEGHPLFYNAAAIESPGLASAPAIAEYLANCVMDQLHPQPLEGAKNSREDVIVVSELSEEEKNRLAKENPLYAKYVCRCEKITEGEIVDCIHRTCGARSVKGVKKRVRPGMGRCQGGFCEPLVVSILARELGIDEKYVVLDRSGSYILKEENR